MRLLIVAAAGRRSSYVIGRQAEWRNDDVRWWQVATGRWLWLWDAWMAIANKHWDGNASGTQRVWRRRWRFGHTASAFSAASHRPLRLVSVILEPNLHLCVYDRHRKPNPNFSYETCRSIMSSRQYQRCHSCCDAITFIACRTSRVKHVGLFIFVTFPLCQHKVFSHAKPFELCSVSTTHSSESENESNSTVTFCHCIHHHKTYGLCHEYVTCVGESPTTEARCSRSGADR